MNSIILEFNDIISYITVVLSVVYFLVFSQSRKKEFLFYSLYLFVLFIFFFKNSLPQDFLILKNYVNFILLFIAFIFYISFVRNILNTRLYIPNWDKILVLVIQLFIFFIPVFVVIQYFLGYHFQRKIFLIIAPVFTVFSFLSYIEFAKIKGGHVIFFMIGSFSFVILANISLFSDFVLNSYLESKGIKPIYFAYLGIAIEAVTVTLILGVQLKYYELKRKEAELLLEEKAKEKINLKMIALQSQMDPHFLYNSLNSINNFVLKNDAEKASDYITKFSRLIREILNNSSNMTISLAKELGILNLYIKLEQMRISDGFDYTLVVDNSLDIEKIKVPPLFLQPFVENAIWHGLVNSKEKKIINLHIYDEGENIRCELIDNGVGINKTMGNSGYQSKRRKSFGVQATEDRIKLLHKNSKVYLIIQDISNDKTSGTKVSLKFPKYR